MADEQDEAEVVEEEPKPAGSLGKYMGLIVLILALEGVGGFVLLDRVVPAPEQAGIRTCLEAAGARATAHAPIAWLRVEDTNAYPALDLTWWPGGETVRLAHAHPHGRWIEWS